MLTTTTRKRIRTSVNIKTDTDTIREHLLRMKRTRKSNTSAIESSRFQSFFSKDNMHECPLCGTFMKQKDLQLHASTCRINDIDDLFPPSVPTQQQRSDSTSQPVTKQQKVGAFASTQQEEVTEKKHDSPQNDKEKVNDASVPNSIQKASGERKKSNMANDAFNKMMIASKEKKEKRFIFRLDLVDNRLLYDITDELDVTADGKENTNTVWEEKVNLRGLPTINGLVTSPNIAVILRTNIEGAGLMSLSEEDEFARKKSDTYVIGILKSILQKAVRRRNSEAAKRVAATIMALSMDDLLRRLPIIMVEDSLFNPEFVVIVFLMMAHSKGYRIPISLLHTCVKFAEDIADCRHKEPEISEGEGTAGCQEKEEDGEDGEEDDEETIPAVPKSLALALLFRCSYGGMRGDMQMLVNAAKRTLTRFRSSQLRSKKGSINSKLLLIPSIKSSLHHNIIKTILQYPWGEAVLLNQFTSTKIDVFVAEGQSPGGNVNPIKHLSKHYQLRREDLLPVGVDFHCDPALITHLVSELQREQNSEQLLRIKTIAKVKNENNPGIVENAIHDLLKRCIWIFRSSVNHRTPLPMTFKGGGGGGGDDAVDGSTKSSDLSMKKKLGPVWNAIAKMTNQYCSSKCNALFVKLQNNTI